MQRRKPSKALEKIAREICDRDDFVEHVAGISSLYRRQHELDAGPRRTAVRQALRTFERHAAQLSQWMKSAGVASRPEHDALVSIDKALRGSTHEHATAVEWLGRAAHAASQAIEGLKSGKRNSGAAPRAAAEALRATFEHHRLKWSTSIVRGEPSAAIRLLCAIARHAGDSALTPTDARQAMRPAKS